MTKSYNVTYNDEPRFAVCVECAKDLLVEKTYIDEDWIDPLVSYGFGLYLVEPVAKRAFVPCGYCEKLA
jgi:hypothetical protein